MPQAASKSFEQTGRMRSLIRGHGDCIRRKTGFHRVLFIMVSLSREKSHLISAFTWALALEKISHVIWLHSGSMYVRRQFFLDVLQLAVAIEIVPYDICSHRNIRSDFPSLQSSMHSDQCLVPLGTYPGKSPCRLESLVGCFPPRGTVIMTFHRGQNGSHNKLSLLLQGRKITTRINKVLAVKR